MDKIILKQTHIEINDYRLGESKLDSIFSIYDRITHSLYFKGIDYNEETKTLYLPRGIDIYYLENLFSEKAVVDRKYDEFDYTEPIKIKYLPRDEVQKEALKYMLGESVNYRKNKECSQLSVNLNTGRGKTYCSIATSAFLNIRSIIITSSINWLEQWRDCILEYTDTKEKEIYMLTGSASIFRLLQKDMSQYKFILASHATLKSYGDKHGYDKISELFKYMRVGLKFYDESHLHFDNMCKLDFYTNTYKTYYVTATPKRSNEDEDRIFQLYFKNIPSIDLFDEDNDPHTNYISIKYNSRPTPQQISDCKNQYGLDRNRYTNYIVYQENFYKILHLVLDIVLKSEGKTLIYIGTNSAIQVVYEWILNNYPEFYNNIGIYTSIITENKEEQLEKKLILSTTKSCGAAVDIKGLKNTVVLAEPFKSEVLARQTLGRTRADNTNYFEIVDTGFVQINKYYQYKKPVFEKYACSCNEIVLKDRELDARVSVLLGNRIRLYYRPLFIPFKVKPLFVECNGLKPLFRKA